MHNSRRGFTLIEMVIVVTIIGILSSLVVVNYNAVLNKAEAARIATQLHYVEEGVIEALLDGLDVSTLSGLTTPANVESSAFGPYLTSANLGNLPDGVTLSIAIVAEGNSFDVVLLIRSDDSHTAIIEELHTMLPRQIDVRNAGHMGWIRINIRDLAISPVTAAPSN